MSGNFQLVPVLSCCLLVARQGEAALEKTGAEAVLCGMCCVQALQALQDARGCKVAEDEADMDPVTSRVVQWHNSFCLTPGVQYLVLWILEV